MKHREKHPEYVEGCFGCKAGTINFGTVPGAHKDSKRGITELEKREKGLIRYAEKRKAGEQPDGTTPEAIEKYERRIDAWEKKERVFEDSAPAESVQALKKSTFNKAA